MPEDWDLSDADYEYAKDKTGRSDDWISRQAELFYQYWRGDGGVKADWAATWRKWVLEANDRKR